MLILVNSAVIAASCISINKENLEGGFLINCFGLHSVLLLQMSNIRDKNKTENFLLVNNLELKILIGTVIIKKKQKKT